MGNLVGQPLDPYVGEQIKKGKKFMEVVLLEIHVQ